MRAFITVLAVICALGAAFGVAWEEDKDDRD